MLPGAPLLLRVPSLTDIFSDGGVSERPKERASKAREGQPSVGSNPTATALCSDEMPVTTDVGGWHLVVRLHFVVVPAHETVQLDHGRTLARLITVW